MKLGPMVLRRGTLEVSVLLLLGLSSGPIGAIFSGSAGYQDCDRRCLLVYIYDFLAVASSNSLASTRFPRQNGGREMATSFAHGALPMNAEWRTMLIFFKTCPKFLILLWKFLQVMLLEAMILSNILPRQKKSVLVSTWICSYTLKQEKKGNKTLRGKSWLRNC